MLCRSLSYAEELASGTQANGLALGFIVVKSVSTA